MRQIAAESINCGKRLYVHVFDMVGTVFSCGRALQSVAVVPRGLTLL